jgi:hypothetical protein
MVGDGVAAKGVVDEKVGRHNGGRGQVVDVGADLVVGAGREAGAPGQLGALLRSDHDYLREDGGV